MEKELEILKSKYEKEEAKLEKSSNKEEVEKKLENIKLDMRKKLLDFKRESQNKLKEAKKELKIKRERVAKFAGKDVLEYKEKIIKEKDDLELQISNINLDQNLDEKQKSKNIEELSSKISKIDSELKLINEVDKNQKALNNYKDSQKEIFEKYRKALNINGIYFDYLRKDNKEINDADIEEKSKEDKEKSKEEKEDKEKSKEEKDKEKSKESKEDKNKGYFEVEYGEAEPFNSIDDKKYEEVKFNSKDYIPNFEMKFDEKDNSNNFKTDYTENQNKGFEQNFDQAEAYQDGYNTGYQDGYVNGRNGVYDDPYLQKNEETLGFKDIMNLRGEERIEYYLKLTEEQSINLVNEIDQGLKDGTITPEEVINFRRIGNHTKKSEIAMAKVVEDKMLRKTYKDMLGKKAPKINESKYGLKLGLLDPRIRFEGYSLDNNVMFNADNVKMNFDKPVDVKGLENDVKLRYETLYNELETKREELGVDYFDNDFANSNEGKFIFAYNLYLDRIMYLKKMEDLEQKMNDLQIDERICEEYRKKHIIKGNYLSDEELLSKDKLLSMKPKFTDRLKKKILGKRYRDKTPDRRFKSVIDKFKEKRVNEDIDKEDLTSKFYVDLNEKVNNREETMRKRKEREEQEKNREKNKEKTKEKEKEEDLYR